MTELNIHMSEENTEQPQDETTATPSPTDGLIDRINSKDLIGSRDHIRSILFSKLKDRLDGLNSATSPIAGEAEVETEVEIAESGVGAALTPDKQGTARRGFKPHYRQFPTEFVWTAEKNGEVIDTAKMNAETLDRAQEAMKDLGKIMAEKGADTIKIHGRDGKVLSSMKIGESVEAGGWNLGDLDKINGTGKAAGAKISDMMVNIREKIVKRGEKYVIMSKDGSKQLGEYDNLKDAQERLRQIEFFKHNK